MNHLENLTKLRDTLKEKLAETESMRDYEATNGSIGAAENLADECKRLNDSIDSLEWAVRYIEENEAWKAYENRKLIEEMKSKIVRP